MNIEVGMLVRIVDHPQFVSGRKYIGHIGKVVAPWVHEFGLHWDISGTNTNEIAFCEDALEIIKPDSEPADEDFQEDLKRWLGKKVTA